MPEPLKSLEDIDWRELTRDRSYFPSPDSWDDETLYFLLVDRFSDGKEFGGFGDLDGTLVPEVAGRTTRPFQLSDAGSANRADWFAAGKTWCGGNLAGLRDKLGYLRRLGVTTVWLSPVFRQTTGSDDYHGYGIQNFLDVDPHYGSREELREVVEAAHDAGIRVILDIILNHAGDVFAYAGNLPWYYFEGKQWPVQGYRADKADGGSLPFETIDEAQHPAAWPDGAVWPRELQAPETWSQRGEIRNWEGFPEYLDADFLSLKDVNHGEGGNEPNYAWDVLRRIEEFRSTAALFYLAQVYKYWIAYADVDGFRIDTVKHTEPGAMRIFCNVIHEYAQSVGKERFYLIGEITGGRSNAVTLMTATGLDAALGINDIPGKLEYLAKGKASPGDPRTDAHEGYFDLFRNSLIERQSTHQWFGKHVVTMFDDHDQVGVKHKYRFCGDPWVSHPDEHLHAAIGLNLTSTGIPCLYYGTEQAFNGSDIRTDDDSYSDIVLRECLFGGPFGSLQSAGRHLFNEQHPAYVFTAKVTKLRSQEIALRRGRQYLREVSGSGNADDFHYPQLLGGNLRWVVAWSRIFADRELLCAINTDRARPLTVWATLDHTLNPLGRTLPCLLSTDDAQEGAEAIVEARNGSAIRVTVPPAGFQVWG